MRFIKLAKNCYYRKVTYQKIYKSAFLCEFMRNKKYGNFVNGRFRLERNPVATEPEKYITLAGFLRRHPIHLEDVGNTDYLRQVYFALRDEVRYVDLTSEKDRKDRSNLLVMLGTRSGIISLNGGQDYNGTRR